MRIDLLRGLAVLAMIVDHVAGPSPLRLLTGGDRFYTSAAEGFVILARITAGLVSVRAVQRGTLARTLRRFRQRACLLYAVVCAVTLIELPLSEALGLPWARGIGLDQPLQLTFDVFTLGRTYHVIDVLALYTLLFGLAPLAGCERVLAVVRAQQRARTADASRCPMAVDAVWSPFAVRIRHASAGGGIDCQRRQHGWDQWLLHAADERESSAPDGGVRVGEHPLLAASSRIQHRTSTTCRTRRSGLVNRCHDDPRLRSSGMTTAALPRLLGTRYVVPLREGGSLPAVVDTDRDGTFVVKFRGAGQGPKALIAEAIVAMIGRALDLPVPTPAVVELEEGFGRSEPDSEIQDVLRGSVGANFGLEYLPSALAFDPAVDAALLSAERAAEIVWLDAFVTNVDRTPRNTNLLVCRQHVWLIDHGAALFMHHRWAGWQQRIQSPFAQIADHVLLPVAGDLEAADARLRPRLGSELVAQIVQEVPEDWFADEDEFADQREQRQAYTTYLVERLNGPRRWLTEAIGAQQRPPRPLGPRLTHRVV